ncbi:MAG: DNA-directed RNA polymerase subunit D [Nanoarchaeota archaeon]|nr:DNA-directed RNA polymerase subunit D [Nanoarchaeota archaeon]
MKIKIIKKNSEKMVFTLEGASLAFANALRRIMISEVPVMAVDWIDVHNNTSVLFDEMLAHRIGMMPIKFDPTKFNLIGECKCESKGCSLCQAVFAVSKTGPCMVYSGDTKPSNKATSFTDGRFPIVELLKRQEVKLEAVARLGRGEEHSKYQAAIVGYDYDPEAKPLKFTLNVETVSGLKPEQIVAKSVEILKSKASDFKKEAAKI